MEDKFTYYTAYAVSWTRTFLILIGILTSYQFISDRFLSKSTQAVAESDEAKIAAMWDAPVRVTRGHK